MTIAISSTTRTPALTAALHALSMTKLARAQNDRPLLTAGMQAHGYALRVLQSAIYDTQRAWEDQTLAAVRVLSTYELHESTMSSTVGWIKHEEGIDRLILMRGPRSYDSMLGRALFEDARRSAVRLSLHSMSAASSLGPLFSQQQTS